MFASSQMQGMGFGDSQAAPSPESASKRPARAEETCLPVTVRALEAALAQRADPSEDLKLFGAEPGVLVLVAMVESVVRQSTGMEMTLNDSTGRVNARYFVTDPLQGELDAIQPGRYISTFGSMRSSPTPHFSANGVRVVESSDEVSYHMIEVAHAMLRLQQPAAQAGATFVKAVNAEPPQTPQKGAAPAEPQATPAAGDTPVQPAVDAPAPTVQGAELQAAVASALRADRENEEGLTPTAIAERVGRGATDASVRAALAALVEAGEAFSTIDDDHFALV